jgi:hypothetical protein
LNISVGDYVVANDINNVERIGVCTQIIVPESLINVLALDEAHLFIYLCKVKGAKEINNEASEHLDLEAFQLFTALQNFLTR